jgi:hypothetical protein
MSTTSLVLAFEADDEINDDFDTASNDDNFGSWYLIFAFARWSSLSNTSLFLTFEVVDETDGNFDTADNDDGDDAEEMSVDDRDDTVEGVETNGDVSGNNEPTAADNFLVFFGVVNLDLPNVAFSRGVFLVFAMVAMNNKFC